MDNFRLEDYPSIHLPFIQFKGPEVLKPVPVAIGDTET